MRTDFSGNRSFQIYNIFVHTGHFYKKGGKQKHESNIAENSK